MELGVRLRKHLGGLIHVEEIQTHDQSKKGTAERLGQPRGVVRGPCHESPVGAEAAVGDQDVQVRMPVGA